MRKLSGELDYRIRYDVEHNLFYAKNVFNEEYIAPTFIEYVQKLERENAELKNERNAFKIYSDGAELDAIKLNEQLTKAKEIIREFVEWANWQGNSECPSFKSIQDKAEQFLEKVK